MPSNFADILGMKRAAAKNVPKLLNFEQKQWRVDIAQEIFKTFNDDTDLLKQIITGDESWVHGFDIETKTQLPQWKRTEEPGPIKHIEFDQRFDFSIHCFLRLQ